MTLLFQTIEEAHQAAQAQEEAHQRAREHAKQLLIPTTLTQSIIERYIRKALRHHAWRTLRPEQKALLHTLRKALKHWLRIRSPTLTELVRDILMEIELHTPRGQAIYYGALMFLKKTLTHLATLAHNTTRALTQLLYHGLSYLNNPLQYRIYG